MHSLVITLPEPQVSGQLLRLDSNEIKQARKYFQRLVHFQNLTVKKPLRNGYGLAQLGSKTIWVPTIRDKGSFMTCLHEVGHSINPIALLDGRVRSEYEADMFAIRRARYFGLDDAFLVEYEKYSKLYVAGYLDAGFRMNKTSWCGLSPKVREVATWLGITAHIWGNATETLFSNKLELPHDVIIDDIPCISEAYGDMELQMADFERDRTNLERMHSHFDLVTRNLVQVSDTSA